MYSTTAEYPDSYSSVFIPRNGPDSVQCRSKSNISFRPVFNQGAGQYSIVWEPMFQ
jgi:hypothetical protein